MNKLGVQVNNKQEHGLSDAKIVNRSRGRRVALNDFTREIDRDFKVLRTFFLGENKVVQLTEWIVASEYPLVTTTAW